MHTLDTQFAFVPYQKMEELLKKVDQITNSLQINPAKKNPLGEYISEADAKELLGKGTTWFWNKRQSGELVGKKAGNKWYYKQEEITAFIENGSSNI